MAATIKIVIDSSSSGSALRDARRDLDDLDGGARRAGGGFDVLKSVGVAAFAAVAAAGVAAAAGIVKFGVDSVKAAGDFEGSVLKFKAVTGDALTKAGFDFEQVQQKALQLGMDTAFSAQQSIEAMTALAKGGVPVVDIMGEATDATLALAAAAGMELAPAADIVAKQLGVWAETGVTASEVADLLASAANASVVDVDELALGLANAGGTAKTAGVGFEDLVQTMALIAPNFSSASDAGTSLKTMISRLIPTTAPAAEAMEALGLWTKETGSAFFDAQGEFIGMEAASRLLHEATAGLSEEEKLLAFNTIFGSDAIRAAAAIANAGAEGFNAMGQSMADAGGAAQQAAQMNQGFNFALDQLKGSIETLQIVLGSMLLPVLTDFLNNVVTPGVNQIMTFVQAFQSAKEGGLQLSTSWGASFQAIKTHVETAMQAVWSVISLVVEQVQIFWQANGAEITAFTQQMWATITEIVLLAVELYSLYISTTFNYIAQFIRTHGAEIQAVLSAVWTTIKSVINIALALIKGLIQTTLALIKGDWEGAWNAIKTMAMTIWNNLKGLFAVSLAFIELLWGDTWNRIKVFFQGIMDGVVGWVLQTLQGIVNALTSFAGVAKSAAGSVGDAIVNGISSGISDGAGKIINAAKDAAMSALNAAKSALGISSPSKVFANLVGKPMAEGMAVGLAGGAPMVAGAGAYAAGAAVAGASTYNQQRAMTYAPTINNYGSPSDGLDFSTAVSLAGV